MTQKAVLYARVSQPTSQDAEDKVSAGLEYVDRLLTMLQAKLPEIDVLPDELKKLLEDHPKSADFLIVVEEEEKISTFEESFQDKVEVIEQTIVPEPVRRVTPIRRRILTYEEQLATKVLFAVSDCYGQATMNPIGPNEFQVSVLRLQMRFFCQGDAILFSEIRAAAQEDIDAFTRCYGQQPELTSDGQLYIASILTSGESVASAEEKPASVVDSMREQLSQISQNSPKEAEEKSKSANKEKQEKGKG